MGKDGELDACGVGVGCWSFWCLAQGCKGWSTTLCLDNKHGIRYQRTDSPNGTDTLDDTTGSSAPIHAGCQACVTWLRVPDIVHEPARGARLSYTHGGDVDI